MPLPISLLIQVDIELHMVLNLVVFRVGWAFCGCTPFTSLIVPEVGGAEHSTLLEDPIDQLLAELHVSWILGHELVTAHLN